MNSLLVRAVLSGVLVCMISACATHELVRPGVRGTHAVTTYGEDDTQTAAMAISQANSYCSDVEKAPTSYVLSEKTYYKGKTKESTYRTMKTLGKVGVGVGGGVAMATGSGAAGGLIGLAGLGATLAADGGYRTEMKFTCKAHKTASR